MKLQKKSVSKLALTDLLRRKRINLEKYLSDNGIISYELLTTRCYSIGVIPPTEDQFLKARGQKFYETSSPTEGIVVLNPLLSEISENKNEQELSLLDDNDNDNDNDNENEKLFVKKSRKKKQF